MKNYKGEIAAAVELWMNKKSLTQPDVAKILNIKQSMLSKRLSGSIRWSVDDLEALARAGVPIPSPCEVVNGDAQ